MKDNTMAKPAALHKSVSIADIGMRASTPRMNMKSNESKPLSRKTSASSMSKRRQHSSQRVPSLTSLSLALPRTTSTPQFKQSAQTFSNPQFKQSMLSRNIADSIRSTLTKNKVVHIAQPPPATIDTGDNSQESPHDILESVLNELDNPGLMASDTPNVPRFPPGSTDPNSKGVASPSYDFTVVHAVRQGDIQQLRQLYRSGTSLVCYNSFGESLLHLACRKGKVDVVNFLIKEAHVSLFIADKMGRTPLHDAFWTPEPNFALIDLLLSKCPTLLLAKDTRGHTPLMYTRRKHWPEWQAYLESRTQYFGCQHSDSSDEEDGDKAVIDHSAGSTMILG